MNLKVLPPKRFDNPFDPYYDPIRHEPWFGKLLTRRGKLALLREANHMWEDGLEQKYAAEALGVDPRELRDYIRWLHKTPRKAISAQEQAILDGAYEVYARNFWVDGGRPFGYCIRHVASLFGVKGRPIEELWEVNPTFWPTGYPPRSGQ